MRQFILYVAILSTILLIACGNETPDSTSEKKFSLKIPNVDLSTPEKTIYSYQDAINWKLACTSREFKVEYHTKIDPVFNPFFQPRIVKMIKENRAFFDEEEKYEFHIESMNNETGARAIAVVRVRNVTPLPAGVDLASASKLRDAGELFTFILENDNSRWLVADIEMLPGPKTVFNKETPKIKTSIFLGIQ